MSFTRESLLAALNDRECSEALVTFLNAVAKQAATSVTQRNGAAKDDTASTGSRRPSASYSNGYTLAELEKKFERDCPAAWVSFPKAEAFTFVLKAGRHALQMGHICTRKHQTPGPILYLINRNPNVNGEVDFGCHTDEPIHTPDLHHYVDRAGFLPKDFWGQALNVAHAGAFSQKISVTFQLIEMLCGRREYFVGSISALCSLLRQYGRSKRAPDVEDENVIATKKARLG